MKRTLRGLRVRLTIVYATLFGFFICAFASIMSGQYIDVIRRDFDAALLNFGLDITQSEMLTPGYQAKLKVSKYESRKQLPFSLGATVFMMRSIDGKVIAESDGLPEGLSVPYRSDLPQTPDYTHRFLSLVHNKTEYRAVNIKMTNAEGQVRILQVATPSHILREQTNRLIILNLIAIPVVILIASLASYLIAGNALRPVNAVTSAARTIAAENLSQRVPETDTKDEISELSRTFNNLLDRLEKSFRAQENFVANASHQLNTPLAIIKGELDLLETKTRTPEEEAKFRKSLREELERLIELVKKLLLISRVESGHASFVMAPVRIDEVLLNTTSRLSTLAKNKKITIRFNISQDLEENSLLIKGDRQLLDAMFENLLENAIKYSPVETTVTIDLEKSDSRIVVCVSDEGPGIPVKDWDSITQGRFKRGEGITIPGTGIGLSIVQSIADLHKSELIYRPRDAKGSKFLIAFPQQKSL